MTFRERWVKEHPGEEFRIGYVRCPSNHGYRPKETVNDCKPVTCTQCWDREIPEKRGCIIGDEKIEHPDTDIPENMVQPDDPLVIPGAGPLTSIKDSGNRTEFETGAVRDMREGKGRCDLMPLEVAAKLIPGPDATDTLEKIRSFQKYNDTGFLYSCLDHFARHIGGCDSYQANMCTLLLEVAKHFEEGAKKYGENNWQKGIPVHCYIDSAIRHYLKWLRGDKDEPHDRAFVWNIMCCIWEVDYHLFE